MNDQSSEEEQGRADNASTNETMDFIGRKEGIAAVALAQVEQDRSF